MPTSNFAWPYPASTDAPNVPTHIRNLADAVDATVGDIVADLIVPIASVRQTVAQPLTDAAFTTLTFTTEDLDTHDGHSTSANTSRYTAQTAGRHVFAGGVGFAANGAGGRGARWLKNGSAIPRGQCMHGNAGAGVATLLAVRTVVVDLAVGDYVELQAYQDSGAPLTSPVLGTQESYIDVWFLR